MMFESECDIPTPPPPSYQTCTRLGQSFQPCPQSSGPIPASVINAYDSLCCLLKQEEKYYMYQNYLSEDLCHTVDIGLGMSSDNSLQQPATTFTTDITNSKGVNKVPSAVCVKDLEKMEVDVTTSPSSLPSPCVVSDTSSTATARLLNESPVMNKDVVTFWRQQMFDWSNLVVDSFDISREVVAVAFNILDRYVAKESTTSTIPITREDFQLFCMTSLYIAVKTLEPYPRKLSVTSLVEMSQGFYNADDIQITECEILKALGWFVNPPTCYTFCRIYWSLFPIALSTKMEATCQALIEIATSEKFFISKKPSLIGLAVIFLAADLDGISNSSVDSFAMNISGLLNWDDNKQWKDCYDRLKALYSP